MFVKHINENNFFDEGFTLNPLTRESFSKQLIDCQSISTYVQAWLNINTYLYVAITDKEGKVESGKINNKEELKELNRRFFEDHKREFLFRQLPQRIKSMNPLDDIQSDLLLDMIKQFDEKEIDETLKRHFGEWPWVKE